MMQNIILAIVIAAIGILYMNLKILEGNNEFYRKNIKVLEKHIENLEDKIDLLENKESTEISLDELKKEVLNMNDAMYES